MAGSVKQINVLCRAYDLGFDYGYEKGKADRDQEIIKMIEDHQKECDALHVIAPAQWVKDQIREEMEWGSQNTTGTE